MQLKVGEIVEGTVKSLTKFGAFVALDANTTGLVHISEVAHAYVSDLHEYLTEGQTVKVMVIGLDGGKINLSIKRTLPAPTRQQTQRPRGGFQQRQAQPNRQQPSAPQQKSFDDMLKQFMSESVTGSRFSMKRKTKRRRLSPPRPARLPSAATLRTRRR